MGRTELKGNGYKRRDLLEVFQVNDDGVLNMEGESGQGEQWAAYKYT